MEFANSGWDSCADITVSWMFLFSLLNKMSLLISHKSSVYDNHSTPIGMIGTCGLMKRYSWGKWRTKCGLCHWTDQFVGVDMALQSVWGDAQITLMICVHREQNHYERNGPKLPQHSWEFVHQQSKEILQEPWRCQNRTRGSEHNISSKLTIPLECKCGFSD